MKITTSDLDFDQIKTNLKNYLKGQSTFSDYDFEGSGLSVILDILAYNTHYNVLYSNLAVNESFLDSASKRNSVVSIAKSLGYIPRSITSPSATINLRVYNTSSTPGTLTLPKYTAFSTTIDGTQYSFFTTSDVTTQLSGGEYVFSDLIIREGSPAYFNFTVSNGTRFVIPNPNCDLSTLKVLVKENALSVETQSYEKSDSLLNIDNNSKVYFVKEIEGELYEIEFGDGVLGKALSNGNVVSIEYLVTSGPEANRARAFTYQGQSLLGGQVQITTIQSAVSGSEIENIESIRFNAPKFFSTQNRAITADDYEAIILKNYPEARTVNCWGGEDNNPPVYGKVFVCIKPVSGTKLSVAEKNRIKNTILSNRKGLGTTVELVDPKNIDIQVTSNVYYNPNLTTLTPSDIATVVSETIEDYNTNNLERFDSGYRNSQLSSLIDMAENSITSNATVVSLKYTIEPFFDMNSRYDIFIVNPIVSGQNGSVVSTGFTVFGSNETMFLEDDGQGNLRQYFFTSTNEKSYVATVGTIDYSNGNISIPALRITSAIDDFVITIRPVSYDVISVRDQIVRIPSDLINVNIIVDQMAVGNTGSNFIFSSNRS